MEKTIIRTDKAPAPVGPYSQAVRASGTFIFAAGQIAIDPLTNQLLVGGIQEQTRLVLNNLRGVLQGAGARLENVVKTTVYLKDMNDLAEMNEVYSEFFPDAPPARSAVEVARLPRDVKVEIEAIASMQESFRRVEPESFNV
jgi:2-iminobutanoate/2-iminopropanoate deaminase